MTVDFDPVDISSDAFWTQPMRERDEAFSILRTRPSISFHEPIAVGSAKGSQPFWAAVKHADIVHVSRRPGEFCSGEGIGYSNIPKELNEPFGSFMMTDAPRHTHLRGIVSRAFTPKQVAKIEEQIQAQARVIVADAVAEGSGDIVTMVSNRLPLWTISEMLGVPEQRRTELQEAATAMVSTADPKLVAQGVNPFHSLFNAAITLSTLGTGTRGRTTHHARRRPADRARPGRSRRRKLTDQEIGSFVVLLGVGGNDTTRNSISHAMRAFAQNPDQWDLLRTDPDRWIPKAVEEILRWASPVMTFRRTATADTHIGDQAIAKGDFVVMFYPSGNRDERVFSEPLEVRHHPRAERPHRFRRRRPPLLPRARTWPAPNSGPCSGSWPSR